MECPYCHGEMEAGTLGSARDPVYWYPKGKRVFFPTKDRVARQGGIRLGGCNPGAYRKVDAWYCRTCNRLTIMNAK